MLEAKNRNKGVLMVAHILRFWPAYRVLHHAVAGRAYGAIHQHGLPAERACLAGAMVVAAGGAWWRAPLDLLVDDYDQALWLIGAPRVRPRAPWAPPT
jgi:predicted dehydrogenase